MFKYTLLPRIIAIAVAMLPAGLAAYDYRTPISVQDEADIEELYLSGDLDDEERDRLLDLYRTPLDLNLASREDLYNLPNVTYEMADLIIARRADKPFVRVSDLKELPGFSQEIVAELRPFTMVERKAAKRARPLSNWHGRVTARTAGQVDDPDGDYPEGYVRAQFRHSSGLSFGGLLLGRNTVSPPSYKSAEDGDLPVIVWDFDRYGKPKSEDNGLSPSSTTVVDSYLLTSGQTWLPAWPKLYAGWKNSDYSVLAGSYRIGFGQRLVFDNTGKTNPDGFEPDAALYENNDEFNPAKGLFGAAATVSGLQVGPADISATSFFLWWRFDSYQYDLQHDAGDLASDRWQSYALVTPYRGGYYRKLNYQTLPQAWSEILGGGHIEVALPVGLTWGFTGYYADLDFHLDDPDTTFAVASPFPQRDSFGVVGTDLAFRQGRFHTWAEVAMTENQGWAGIAKAYYDGGPLRVEALYRYYADNFENPHSRGYNSADEFEGDRDRGEHGGRVSLRWNPVRWASLRWDSDVWQATQWDDSQGQDKKVHPWRMEHYLRTDFKPLPELRFGAFVQFNDRDVSEFGRDQVYSEAGEKTQFGAQTAWSITRNWSIWLYYKMSLYGDGISSWQKDHYVTFKTSWRPLDLFNVQARYKYFKGELEDSGATSREHFMESYVQVGIKIYSGMTLLVRGMVHEDLDVDDPTEFIWRLGFDWRF